MQILGSGPKNNSIQKVVDQYLSLFKEETADLQILSEQLTSNVPIVGRENTKGHVTASGIILHEGKILLIFHNKLQKYIQPGGHVEKDDASLWEAAEREVGEETGMKLTLHSWHNKHNFIPIDIDSHLIPENSKKEEPEHFHHDFAFIFQLTNDKNVILQVEEVSDFKWVGINQDFGQKHLDKISKKVSALHIS